ncbi:hypothetical protein [Cyanobium sp. NIES-981]|uniref:hypothetical protein n=1 Tax=Cyanobium sp. NIES-981 TaxID=1851505 RepID=UPI0007DDEF5C|nr:hypothetical protein [Cyanobium sp. NIES-981]SBO42490.1 conserved exported protein of unknown function [Cyanobium sp. NIES-981]
MVRLSRPFLAAGLAALVGAALPALPLMAQEGSPAAQAPVDGQAPGTESGPEARTGSETSTSFISEVDACNRAQKLRPAGSIVTRMHYWRQGVAGERSVTCTVNWSTRQDARPTHRPILFGPTA